MRQKASAPLYIEFDLENDKKNFISFLEELRLSDYSVIEHEKALVINTNVPENFRKIISSLVYFPASKYKGKFSVLNFVPYKKE